MLELRFHGRGGQGAVTATKALAIAAAQAGFFVQTFPEYGVERRGAPVAAYTRIDDKPIYIRSKIYAPTDVVVLDSTLVKAVNVIDGLQPGGCVIINSDKEPEDFHLPETYRVITVDASRIAVSHGLGTKATPIVNTPVLGILAAIKKIVGMDAVSHAVREIAPVQIEDNLAAAQEGYDTALRRLEALHAERA